MQARIRATAVWATDGTRTVIRHEKAPWEYVIARSAVRHDGARFGGRVVEPEGADNYLAELAALMDVALASEPGERIIIGMSWSARRTTTSGMSHTHISHAHTAHFHASSPYTRRTPGAVHTAVTSTHAPMVTRSLARSDLPDTFGRTCA